MNDKRFIVVSGLPGSGKTTLARRLSQRLGLPLLDKDEILERLFELKGTGDTAWRRALSRESDDLLEHEARASQGAVLVSFWHVAGMPASSGTPTAWLRDLADLVVHIPCICAPEVAAARFRQRRRHPGHLDHESTYADTLASFQAQAKLGPLSLRPTISVDTTDWADNEEPAELNTP